jgi:transposase-like protein
MWSRGRSIDDVNEELEISKHSIIDWFNFCRDVCINWIHLNPIKLGGFDHNFNPIDVEIDKSCFFKRKYNHGVLGMHNWVFGAIERGSNKCVIIPVPNRRAETLIPLIQQHINLGSCIISDEWAGYNSIDEIGQGDYSHVTVNHSEHFVHPVFDDIHTQNIESLWSRLKKMMRRVKTSSKDLFSTYFIEFMWRESNTGNVFSNFLVTISEQYPF